MLYLVVVFDPSGEITQYMVFLRLRDFITQGNSWVNAYSHLMYKAYCINLKTLQIVEMAS